MSHKLEAVCLDCGLDYAEFPMDVLMPRQQWLTINPSDGGLLCAMCIVKRAAKIPGAVALHAVIGIVATAPKVCAGCDNLKRFDATKEYFNCPTLNIRIHAEQIAEFGCTLWEQKTEPETDREGRTPSPPK